MLDFVLLLARESPAQFMVAAIQPLQIAGGQILERRVDDFR